MVGSVASSSARSSHAVDRFYNPPALRRQIQQQQLLQQQQLQQQQHRPVRQKAKPAPPPQVEVRDVESRIESDDSSSRPSVSSSPSPSPPPLPLRPRSPAGNLDRFLEFTTPVVRAQYSSKKNPRDCRHLDGVDLCPYFSLNDLWDFFKEWSAYGAGVPLVLNGSDDVIQYYVPYLSGIQLYVDSSRLTSRTRRSGECSDGEVYRDISRVGSAGCSADRRSDCTSEAGGIRRITERLSRVFVADKACVGPEGSSCDDGDVHISPGHLIFEYLERDPPYGREPLSDKISDLARQFPELETYKSSDLLSSSWISVAWYPIYRIPTGPTLRDLESCFLTFHSLATPSKSIPNGHVDIQSFSVKKPSYATDASAKLSLPIFGLASYKFRGSIWTSDGSSESEQANSLIQAAENWLRLLKVEHPDFRFFSLSQWCISEVRRCFACKPFSVFEG